MHFSAGDFIIFTVGEVFDPAIHLQRRGRGRSRPTHSLMDSGERLPERANRGMNEWYPLDKMAVGKLEPLCINEEELGGSREGS